MSTLCRSGYIVICLDDGGDTWTIATSTIFALREYADTYAKSVAPSRLPHVVALGEKGSKPKGDTR